MIFNCSLATAVTMSGAPSGNPHSFRDKMRERLTDIFDAPLIAENAERGIFNATIESCRKRNQRPAWDNPDFAQSYLQTALRVTSNLDPASYVHNSGLLQRLKSREIQPHEVAYMHYEELFPETWSRIQELINLKNQKMVEISYEGTTDQYTCRRCRRKVCYYTTAQTRSGDEGMTTIVQCAYCKNHWKESG